MINNIIKVIWLILCMKSNSPKYFEKKEVPWRLSQHSLPFIDFNLFHNDAHSYLIVIQDKQEQKAKIKQRRGKYRNLW